MQVNARPFETQFAMLLCVALLVRIFVANQLVDLVVPYTAPEGFIAFKIHPGTYLMFICVALEVMRSDMRTLIDVRKHWPLLLILGAAGFAALTSVIQGRTQAVGYLIDSMFCGAFAAWLVSRMSMNVRQMILNMIIGVMTLNVLLAMFEFATQFRLLPFYYQELTFRPTGLMTHPLDNGLLTLTAMLFIPALRLPFALRIGLMTFFLLGLFLSGARASTLIGCLFFAIAFITMIRTEARRDPRQVGMVMVGVLAVIVIAPIILMSGLADTLTYRLQEKLIDQSAMTRIDIFGVLQYLSTRELLLGSDIGKLNMLSRVFLNNASIESPIVMMIFQFGLIVTIVLFGSLMYGVFRSGTLRVGAMLAVIAFLIAANTNNALNVKSNALTFVLALTFSLPLRQLAPAAATAVRRVTRPMRMDVRHQGDARRQS